MPTYNCERFIAQAIRSVISQTYTNLELLIVDDCSTDKTADVVASFEDKRIHYQRNVHNLGAAMTRNEALKTAKGRYIAFLDSDDIWVPDKLEKQIAFMEQHGYAFTFADYQIMQEDGSLTGKRLHMPSRLTYNQYLRNTAIGCLTVVIDRQQTGEFMMPNIKSSHDMALWLLIMKRGFDAYAIPECMASYRLVATSNTAKKWKAAQDVWKVYRDIEKLGVVYSAFCFCGYVVHAILKRL
jgi:teichuronic acid biosynthesis glycosyltransferase TuaG